MKYRSPRLSSWIFPISTLLHSLSGARGRRIRIPRVTGNLGNAEVNPSEVIQDFFLYQEPDERKRWKEVIAFPVPAGLWRKLEGSLEVQAMGEVPQATGFPMGMVEAIVNPLLSAVRALLTLLFSLELLQVVDNSWSMSRKNISCLSQELGASDELIKVLFFPFSSIHQLFKSFLPLQVWRVSHFSYVNRYGTTVICERLLSPSGDLGIGLV